MTDRNLEESIYQLQKLNNENGVKPLVEEAAQLFAAGRHMEASALMEKAEAMVAKGSTGAVPAANPSVPAAVSHSGRAGGDERGKIDEQVMAGMAVKLADGMAKILTGAFQELERHIVGESRKLSSSFEQHLARLQASVENLTHLGTKFEQLTSAVSEQRAMGATISQQYDRVSASVTSIEEVIVRQEHQLGALRTETGALRNETNTLRGEAREVSLAVTQQMEGLSARLGLQQEELAGLKSTMSEISRKVAGFVERVDRQGDVIRALTETQSRRAAALDDLLGALTKLKTSAEPLAAAAAAGQF
jgi:hypothetical protein